MVGGRWLEREIQERLFCPHGKHILTLLLICNWCSVYSNSSLGVSPIRCLRMGFIVYCIYCLVWILMSTLFILGLMATEEPHSAIAAYATSLDEP